MQLHIIALLPLLAGAHASPINANDARATGTRGDQPPTVPATPFPSMPMPPTTASAAVPASVATPLPLQGISIGVSDYTRVLKVTEYMMPSDLETLYDYEKIKGKKTSVAQALFDKRKTAIDVSGPFVKTFELPPLDEVQYMDGWKELTGDRAMYGLDIEFSIASKDYATQCKIVRGKNSTMADNEPYSATRQTGHLKVSLLDREAKWEDLLKSEQSQWIELIEILDESVPRANVKMACKVPDKPK